jgi:radical SAM superfamily enzyme with C-terminal helix-hairpin-helix motif
MNAEAVIIDGYVDEPACLGVPPYISPYIRAIAGVLKEHGFSLRKADQRGIPLPHINKGNKEPR